MIIGLDFDNTLIQYDQLFYSCALEKDLISRDCLKVKNHIRDQIRLRKNGELEWQKLQAYVYGPGIDSGYFDSKIVNFVRLLRKFGCDFKIVSHKSQFAAQSNTCDLRESALQWMLNKNFFNDDGLQFNMSDVYFEDTRIDKVGRIASLGCSVFVDDLIETFQESVFPNNVIKILFNRSSVIDNENIVVSTDWDEITQECKKVFALTE